MSEVRKRRFSLKLFCAGAFSFVAGVGLFIELAAIEFSRVAPDVPDGHGGFAGPAPHVPWFVPAAEVASLFAIVAGLALMVGACFVPNRPKR